MDTIAKKPYVGISMEGGLATWYAKMTRKDMDEFRNLACDLKKDLPHGSRILEIAPGPGFLSVEMAKLGDCKVTGLDISQSFVKMATQYAKKEGVIARFIHGSASDIPLEDDSFDFIVCRAAFKNFSEPLLALNEMHRVLKPGARAVIIDLRKDTSMSEIVAYIESLRISKLNAWFMKMAFKHMLLKRAYTEEQIKKLGSESMFKDYEVVRTPIGMTITLQKGATTD
jgi:ubiquinone/menaquinone biosynthesis C-methylase UbiE